MYTTVVFDVDGVMLDSEPFFAEARAYYMKRYGLTPPDIKNVNGSGMLAFWQNALAANGSAKAPTAQELAQLNFEYCLTRILDNDTKETTGLSSLLRYLKDKGYRLAVASSSDKFYVESVLEHLRVHEYFEKIICGDQVRNAKPFPDLYEKAVEAMNAEKRFCVAVEDSDNGIHSARTAGIDCIGVCLLGSAQNFSECTAKVYSLPQISEIL